ncbi:hypothetical protein F5Y01DRAFT_315402 [Xylaria sp. FL0043]|nr:hypothetical protein F5Y01DRAFT_315402 [Xylaria sp. FL0043]
MAPTSRVSKGDRNAKIKAANYGSRINTADRSFKASIAESLKAGASHVPSVVQYLTYLDTLPHHSETDFPKQFEKKIEAFDKKWPGVLTSFRQAARDTVSTHGYPYNEGLKFPGVKEGNKIKMIATPTPLEEWKEYVADVKQQKSQNNEEADNNDEEEDEPANNIPQAQPSKARGRKKRPAPEPLPDPRPKKKVQEDPEDDDQGGDEDNNENDEEQDISQWELMRENVDEAGHKARLQSLRAILKDPQVAAATGLDKVEHDLESRLESCDLGDLGPGLEEFFDAMETFYKQHKGLTHVEMIQYLGSLGDEEDPGPSFRQMINFCWKASVMQEITNNKYTGDEMGLFYGQWIKPWELTLKMTSPGYAYLFKYWRDPGYEDDDLDEADECIIQLDTARNGDMELSSWIDWDEYSADDI